MVIREYCSVTGRLGSVKIYNSRSEYPFGEDAGGRGGRVKEWWLSSRLLALHPG